MKPFMGVDMRRLNDLIKNKRAAVAVEYGLILALIFLAMVTAIRGFASESSKMWNNVANEVSSN